MHLIRMPLEQVQSFTLHYICSTPSLIEMKKIKLQSSSLQFSYLIWAERAETQKLYYILPGKL